MDQFSTVRKKTIAPSLQRSQNKLELPVALVPQASGIWKQSFVVLYQVVNCFQDSSALLGPAMHQNLPEVPGCPSRLVGTAYGPWWETLWGQQ